MCNEIFQTKQWLEKVIIGLNFCPFAKKEFVNQTIHYSIDSSKKLRLALEHFATQCEYLAQRPELETSLLIYNEGFKNFEQYLDLVDYSNDLLAELGYEGVFQLASFHPEYCFEGEDFDDASNFTNRSPYPTIHIIREESMARVLSVYKNPELIPDNNIELAHKKGNTFFEAILKSIKHS